MDREPTRFRAFGRRARRRFPESHSTVVLESPCGDSQSVPRGSGRRGMHTVKPQNNVAGTLVLPAICTLQRAGPTQVTSSRAGKTPSTFNCPAVRAGGGTWLPAVFAQEMEKFQSLPALVNA